MNMNKIAIVKGIGPNEVEIPCMVFPNYEEAVEYVAKAFGNPPDFQGAVGNNRAAQWEGIGHLLEEQSIAEKFFNSYYDGCGECWSIDVLEIDFGVPLVSWNLD